MSVLCFIKQTRGTMKATEVGKDLLLVILPSWPISLQSVFLKDNPSEL